MIFTPPKPPVKPELIRVTAGLIIWKCENDHTYIGESQIPVDCPVCAKIKSLEMVLRTIVNITLVLQPAEKCQEVLIQIQKEAAEGLGECAKLRDHNLKGRMNK